VTKTEAAEKVAKLRMLAERNPNPNEAKAARERAAKIMAEHGLTEVDISVGARAAAFDELAERLEGFVRRHEVPAPVYEVFDHIKKKTAKEDKGKALEKIVGIVRLAGLFGAIDPTVKTVKKAVDEVLEKHKITI